MKQDLLQFYDDYKKKASAYELALSTMYFDNSTIAPSAGASHRNAMMALLSGELFMHTIDPAHIEKIEALYKEEGLDPEMKKELRMRLKEVSNERHVPKDVYVSFTQAVADSEQAWHDAKVKKDYQLFKPHLLNVIQKRKAMLSYIPKEMSDYDYLLDSYQTGMNIEKYDAFFEEIKTHLIPLIKKINAKKESIDDSLLFTSFSVEKQAQFMEVLKTYFNFNADECYLASSEHPFTSFLSAHDVRITTHFYEQNVMSAILSTVHEYGHALYALQIKDEYNGTHLSKGIGFAMHESQSRLLENHVGRSRAFWQANFPHFKRLFTEELKDTSLDDFIAMINVSRASLIRTEADELSYPLHILIRYELEKEIFNGDVDYDTLDTMWNDKYEAYLGIRPHDDAQGILQDMHWSAAYVGYFPTYALGSAFAAQFFHQMQKDLDVDLLLQHEGGFSEIQAWLHTHIHQWGAFKDPEEIMMDTCHEPFNPSYYIHYLVDKFSTLYHV